ncbi:DUF4344 domain-containing metallopeptidase [Hyella patelloides]|uniref:DUF4344 domain-containing metallopeptidase n=1 Tax=Hyella patelloides TaxID=1982969 RepID=UPI001643A3EC|nr:DUF4344 domain-containing metallopeptidase [Hyella patelloides]
MTSKEVNSFPININNFEQKTKGNQNKQLPTIGKFQLQYNPTSKYQRFQRNIQASRVFNTVVEKLNKKNLNLPVNIPIVFRDCGEANAFYDLKAQKVIMCYELFEIGESVFVSGGYSQEQAQVRSIYNGVFILLHEVGHALVDNLDLAFTGKEEDSVDDFAATFVLDEKNGLPEEIIWISGQFFSVLPDGDYWDEHSFGQQRFYNLVCLLFGKNPQQYVGIAEQAGLGKDRAVRCHSEYQDKVSSWQRLLAPHYLYDRDTPATNTSNSSDPLY